MNTNKILPMDTTRKRKNQALFETFVKTLEVGTAKFLNYVADILHGKPSDLFGVPKKTAIELPRDMYAHSDVQTEWCYYTGHCTTGKALARFRGDASRKGSGELPMRNWSVMTVRISNRP